MGIKTLRDSKTCQWACTSEKPPHHMGIKTLPASTLRPNNALKNLPTTWGLRLLSPGIWADMIYL